METAEIKRYLNQIVLYKGNKYRFTGAIFRKTEKEYHYQAELTSLNANSLIICKLEDVEIEQG